MKNGLATDPKCVSVCALENEAQLQLAAELVSFCVGLTVQGTIQAMGSSLTQLSPSFCVILVPVPCVCVCVCVCVCWGVVVVSDVEVSPTSLRDLAQS